MYQQPFDNANNNRDDDKDENFYHNHHSHHHYFNSHSYDHSFFHFDHSDIAVDPLMFDSYAHSLDSSSSFLNDETFFRHQLQPEQPELSSWDYALAVAASELLPLPTNEDNRTTGTDFSLLPQLGPEDPLRQQELPSPPQQSEQPQQQLLKKKSRTDCVTSAPKQKRRSTASNSTVSTASNASSGNNGNDKTVDHSRRLNELQARFRVQLTSRQKSNKKGAAAERSVHYPQRPLPAPAVATITDQPIKAPSTTTGALTTVPSTEQHPQSVPEPSSSSSSSSSATTTTASPYFPSRTMPIQIRRVHGRPNSLSLLDADKRQRQLDLQLEKIDFEDITVAELKEMLRQRGKQATGKKAVLMQRLKAEREHRRLEVYGSHAIEFTGGGGASRRFMPYGGTMTSVQQQQRQQLQQQQQQQHKYVPVISSALATPDHDEEINPFDHLIMQYDMGMSSAADTTTVPNDQGYFGGFHYSM
ncbi:hypothetical protein BX666DRAFT_2023847 [Dichotomocladium elegans]|nr:hypothetical protein BX666DRAFT_2023847 [Dichotomocladium elegans]